MASFPRPILLGGSAPMVRALQHMERVAPTDLPVTIVGETGTGKDEAARLIHWLSPRRAFAFIAQSCARLTSKLAESELFGHERGAFTGAVTARSGSYAAADRGSFFLNELHRAKRRAQGLLLEALDDRGYPHVGGTVNIDPDVRLIVASSILPATLAASGRLDEHLLHRLATFPILLPPLRDRIDDIDLLLPRAMELVEQRYGIRSPRWSSGAIAALKSFHWPGNVRQFLGVVRESIANADGAVERALVKEILDQQGLGQVAKRGSMEEKVRLTRETYARLGSDAATARALGCCEKTSWRRRHQGTCTPVG